jgi:hypothetical protein
LQAQTSATLNEGGSDACFESLDVAFTLPLTLSGETVSLSVGAGASAGASPGAGASAGAGAAVAGAANAHANSDRNTNEPESTPEISNLSLPFYEKESAELVLEVWDANISGDSLIGSAVVSLSQSLINTPKDSVLGVSALGPFNFQVLATSSFPYCRGQHLYYSSDVSFLI